MAKSKDQYSDTEAAARLVAALKGAQIAESKPMKSVTPKQARIQHQKRDQKNR